MSQPTNNMESPIDEEMLNWRYTGPTWYRFLSYSTPFIGISIFAALQLFFAQGPALWLIRPLNATGIFLQLLLIACVWAKLYWPAIHRRLVIASAVIYVIAAVAALGAVLMVPTVMPGTSIFGFLRENLAEVTGLLLVVFIEDTLLLIYAISTPTASKIMSWLAISSATQTTQGEIKHGAECLQKEEERHGNH